MFSGRCLGAPTSRDLPAHPARPGTVRGVPAPGVPHHIQVVKLCLHPTFVQASLLLNYTTGLNAVYNTLLYKNREAYAARQAAAAAGVPEEDLSPCGPAPCETGSPRRSPSGEVPTSKPSAEQNCDRNRPLSPRATGGRPPTRPRQPTRTHPAAAAAPARRLRGPPATPPSTDPDGRVEPAGSCTRNPWASLCLPARNSETRSAANVRQQPSRQPPGPERLSARRQCQRSRQVRAARTGPGPPPPPHGRRRPPTPAP